METFMMGFNSYCISIYTWKNRNWILFSKTNPGSGYGAAGSIVLILLWVSYSSMIFFYRAEFTRAYADFFTGKVSPTEVDVKTTDKAEVKH
jgi:uncharacterized BrkB/YihY/UPF0761 family membrane protein